jgi:hypothetical protein
MLEQQLTDVESFHLRVTGQPMPDRPTRLKGERLDREMIDSLDVQSGIRLSETLQENAFSLARRRVEAAVSE